MIRARTTTTTTTHGHSHGPTGYQRTRTKGTIDPSGTFHVSPLLGFEEATKLHEQQALLACLALFQRNPAGFDFPELLDRLFLPRRHS